MSEVGNGFGALLTSRRGIQRALKNPLDKTTLVSIFPREINEIKHTIFPGRFIIPKPAQGDFSTLLIEPSSWYRMVDENMPDLEFPVSSYEIAQSIINDYSVGLVGCNMADKRPGLFFVPGNVSRDEIRKNYKDELARAHTHQNNWFKELVRVADILWARSNGNPLSISDDARLAAETLGLKTKPWMQDFRTLEMIPCPGCNELINSATPICRHCHVIVNQKLFDERKLQFAS